jgi:hypothetical protein
MDDYYLAVDNGFACDFQRASNLGEAFGPIQPISGEDLLPSAVEVNLDAVAVKLDLMKPLVTPRHLRLQRCKLGLNEPRHLNTLWR